MDHSRKVPVKAMTKDSSAAPPIERFIRALFALESEDEVFAPGCVSWHNFDRLDVVTVPDAFDGMRWAYTIMPDMHLGELTSYVVDDEVSVAKYTLRGTLPNGDKMDAPAVVFAFSRGGQVFRTEEYLDSAQSVSLFAKFGSEWAAERLD